MSKCQTKIETKAKKMGRPATGHDPARGIRMPDKMWHSIGVWAARQPDKPGHSEAIRRLLQEALATAAPRRTSIGM
jgi:hypothetical protein